MRKPPSCCAKESNWRDHFDATNETVDKITGSVDAQNQGMVTLRVTQELQMLARSDLPGPSIDLLRLAGRRRFSTILADPPWQFINKTGKVAPEHKRLSRYGTMKLSEIMALPVHDIAASTAIAGGFLVRDGHAIGRGRPKCKPRLYSMAASRQPLSPQLKTLAPSCLRMTGTATSRRAPSIPSALIRVFLPSRGCGKGARCRAGEVGPRGPCHRMRRARARR